MDTLYTLLINAGNGPRVSDGVDRATGPASDVFPYLEPPKSSTADRPASRGYHRVLHAADRGAAQSSAAKKRETMIEKPTVTLELDDIH